MLGMSASTVETARLTVDLPVADYTGLRIAAAEAGRGVSMSSLIRALVRWYLDSEDAEDAADLALAKARIAASGGATITTEQLNAQLADLL